MPSLRNPENRSHVHVKSDVANLETHFAVLLFSLSSGTLLYTLRRRLHPFSEHIAGTPGYFFWLVSKKTLLRPLELRCQYLQKPLRVIITKDGKLKKFVREGDKFTFSIPFPLGNPTRDSSRRTWNPP